MGIDPQDCQVVTVSASELGERRHADGALASEGCDPCRVVLADELQGGYKLPEDDCLGFHTVAVG